MLKPEPLADRHRIAQCELQRRSALRRTRSVILLSAQGERFTQSMARELAQLQRVVLIAADTRVWMNASTRSLRPRTVDWRLCFNGWRAGSRNCDGCDGAPASRRAWKRGVSSYKASVPRIPVPLKQENLRARRMEVAGCWIIRTTRARRNFAGCRCRRCCAEATTPAIRKWRREQALLKTMRNRPDLLKKCGFVADGSEVSGESDAGRRHRIEGLGGRFRG